MADGNGNITEYLGSNGVVVAHREFDPYGNTLVQTGSKAGEFCFWFSSKYWDVQTKHYYYGYRYYNGERWISRDSIGEMRGSLYEVAANNPITLVDLLGMMEGMFDPAKEDKEFDSPSILGVLGGYDPILYENDYKCDCGKMGPNTLTVTFTHTGWYSIAVKSAPAWSFIPLQSGKGVLYPVPANWSSMDFASKRAWAVGHELIHVAHHEKWYNDRKYIIESFEMLVYPDKAQCEQRGTLLKKENNDGFDALKKAEESHADW